MLASAARALGWIQLPADMSGKLAVVTGEGGGQTKQSAQSSRGTGALWVSAASARRGARRRARSRQRQLMQRI